MADEGMEQDGTPESDQQLLERVRSLPLMVPEPIDPAPPRATPAAPEPSGPRLRINLVPGAPRPFVNVPFAAEAISDKVDSKLRDAVGVERWTAFKRLYDEFSWSLKCADDAVDLLTGAITDDDFTRWTRKARKELDIATARFAIVQGDLGHSPEMSAEFRSRLSELEAKFVRFVGKGPPLTTQMRITGEYER